MIDGTRISEVRLKAATEGEQRTGLLGYLTIVVNDFLRIDGITLRRTRRGDLTLSYPERRDRSGQARSLVRPICNDARLEIERQVLAALPGILTSESTEI